MVYIGKWLLLWWRANNFLRREPRAKTIVSGVYCKNFRVYGMFIERVGTYREFAVIALGNMEKFVLVPYHTVKEVRG